EGNIIYSGSIDVIAPDTATTSIITPELGAKSANEILKLYPNPNNGSFTVTFATESEGNMDLQIINNAGQVIQSETLWIDRPGLHEYRIDAPGLPDGVNHIILRDNQGTQSKAFIRR
nr:T9SS type A sorting domain-containing protein [Prolixibacteraceae bacterium]